MTYALRLILTVLMTLTALPLLGNQSCAPNTGQQASVVAEYFEVNNELNCLKWYDMVLNFYVRTMNCTVDESNIYQDPREVEYRGAKWRPMMFRGFGLHQSVESYLAPWVGAEHIFKSADGKEDLDLFEQKDGIVSTFQTLGILKNRQIKHDPPELLIAFDLGLAGAFERYKERLKEAEKLPPAEREAAIFKAKHRGPVHWYFTPFIKGLAQQCKEHTPSGALLFAEASKGGTCSQVLAQDPVLLALFGADRVGQAIALSKKSQSSTKAKQLVDPSIDAKAKSSSATSGKAK